MQQRHRILIAQYYRYSLLIETQISYIFCILQCKDLSKFQGSINIQNRLNRLQAVSRTPRQREPSVKLLRPHFSSNFSRHCVLSGGKAFTLVTVQRNEITICNIIIPPSGDQTHNRRVSTMDSYLVILIYQQIYIIEGIHLVYQSRGISALSLY